LKFSKIFLEVCFNVEENYDENEDFQLKSKFDLSEYWLLKNSLNKIIFELID
jgi:hypothetical protein